MKKRTRARELALQLLYQIDLRGVEMLGEVDRFLVAEESDASAREFASALVHGTVEQREALDEVIRSVAQNWDIERMAVIDRNVLRMSAFELLHRSDIPPKVSINEAIELGKRYSTQNSGGFINGILDKIKDRHVDMSVDATAETNTAANANSGVDTAPAAEAEAPDSGRDVEAELPTPVVPDPTTHG